MLTRKRRGQFLRPKFLWILNLIFETFSLAQNISKNYVNCKEYTARKKIDRYAKYLSKIGCFGPPIGCRTGGCLILHFKSTLASLYYIRKCNGGLPEREPAVNVCIVYAKQAPFLKLGIIHLPLCAKSLEHPNYLKGPNMCSSYLVCRLNLPPPSPCYKTRKNIFRVSQKCKMFKKSSSSGLFWLFGHRQ